jgi:uncharacterized membrane protein
MQSYTWLRILRLIHIYSAIVLVGSIIFNTMILMPALRRIPPAQSAVVSQKIGGGLMKLGGSAIVLLGVTGALRLWLLGELPYIFSHEVLALAHLRWILLMMCSWFGLLVTGTLSGIWYNTVLTKKLPYSAGLRELEERRASQEKVATWQERLAYFNLALALLAALGGILASF